MVRRARSGIGRTRHRPRGADFRPAPGSGPVRLPDQTRRDVLTRLQGAITVASGLGLIHPGFLAAGLAVAVPIVIHLLLRQKARQVDIGSLHFLRVVLRDQAHRRRLRRWILLALRVAGAGLLAALFARPYWSAI